MNMTEMIRSRRSVRTFDGKPLRADATILPKAMGNPPILTIMALARKIAGLV